MDRPLPNLPYTETKRLHLRPLRLPDAEAFRAMTDEPAIIDAIYFLERPFGLCHSASETRPLTPAKCVSGMGLLRRHGDGGTLLAHGQHHKPGDDGKRD
jgi:hypothetical protein